MGGQKDVAAGLRTQAEWAHKLGSPLYNALLSEAAADVEAGGPCWRVLDETEEREARSRLKKRGRRFARPSNRRSRNCGNWFSIPYKPMK